MRPRVSGIPLSLAPPARLGGRENTGKLCVGPGHRHYVRDSLPPIEVVGGLLVRGGRILVRVHLHQAKLGVVIFLLEDCVMGSIDRMNERTKDVSDVSAAQRAINVRAFEVNSPSNLAMPGSLTLSVAFAMEASLKAASEPSFTVTKTWTAKSPSVLGSAFPADRSPGTRHPDSPAGKRVTYLQRLQQQNEDGPRASRSSVNRHRTRQKL